MDDVLHRIGEKNKLLLCSLFNTECCVLHSEMPFTVYPTLLKLQIKKGSDLLKVKSYQSDKACARFAPYIAESIRDDILESLHDARALFVMFDGATAYSVSEVEIVFCRALKNGEPKEFFIGLEDLEHAHAQGVFDAIDRAMLKYGCHDWKEKVIGVGVMGQV